MLWYETLEFLKQVFAERNVVGFDIMELCPNTIDKSSDFLAAKLYYKMLTYKFLEENVEQEYDNKFKDNNTGVNKFSKFNDDNDN